MPQLQPPPFLNQFTITYCGSFYQYQRIRRPVCCCIPRQLRFCTVCHAGSQDGFTAPRMLVAWQHTRRGTAGYRFPALPARPLPCLAARQFLPDAAHRITVRRVYALRTACTVVLLWTLWCRLPWLLARPFAWTLRTARVAWVCYGSDYHASAQLC